MSFIVLTQYNDVYIKYNLHRWPIKSFYASLIYLNVQLSCAHNYVLQMEHRNIIDFNHKKLLLGAFYIFIYFYLVFKNNL